MADKTKAEILREHLRAQAEKKNGAGTTKVASTGDNASYPFWNMKTNESALIRFLPDADPDNLMFWKSREVIKLPFAGQVGGEYATNAPVTVTVPCIDMFGEKCPVIDHIRPWWKDEAKKPLARTYYKKKSFIFQGFVINSPLDEEAPENPIRRFVMGPMLFEIIEKAAMDSEMEDVPTDYHAGCDFKIVKTQKGDFANYGTSAYSRRTRALSESEQNAIETHGLFNLADYLGRKPDADEVAAIKAMFFDSLDGKPFDFESYGKFYRAYGARRNGDDDAVSQVPVASSDSAPEPRSERASSVRSDDNAPPPAATNSKPQAADILARIRERSESNKKS